MKILIETTGNFELVDFNQQGLVIQADRPSVSRDDSYLISSRAAIGQVKIIGTVSDEATDEEFAQYWKDSKSAAEYPVNATDEEKAVADADAEKKRKDLAIAAFMDSYSTQPKPVEPVEPEAKTRRVK